MGLTIERPVLEVPRGGLVADRRLYVDRSGKTLVEETDPRAAFLLAAKGQPMEFDVVTRLGLRMAEGRIVQGPEEIAPLEGIVHPAGAMPEPIMPPESRRSRKK